MGRLREDMGRLREKTRRHRRVAIAVGAVALVAVACKPPVVQTTTGVIHFETTDTPAYATGPIDEQNGWQSDGAAGSGCAVYDHEVDDTSAVGTQPSSFGFGDQSLRMSDAVTSGCFGDQTFTPQTGDEAGETTSSNNGLHSGGTKRGFFETSWSFADAGNPLAVQPGLHVVASPDRGDGARMSWVEMQDCSATIGAGNECQHGAGLEVNFFEYDTTVDDFVFTNVVSNLSRSAAHDIRLRMWFFEGADNDVVQVCVDGTNCLTGNSWEDFFRDGANCDTPCPEPVPTVDSVLFRTGGTADPGNAGNGFYIDNVEVRTANYTGAAFNVTGPASVIETNAGPAGQTAAYSVALDAPVPFTTHVHFATSNGSATAASGDFNSVSQDLTFPPNSVAPQVVNVQINGDTTDESHETFSAVISNATSEGRDPVGAESFPRYVHVDNFQKQTTLLDDDSTISVSDGPANFPEGNAGTTVMPFTVSIANPSAVAVSVHFQTANGSASAPSDYLSVNTTASIPAGATSKIVNVTIKGDATLEPDESFIVNLTLPVNAVIGDGIGAGIIRNDDT